MEAHRTRMVAFALFALATWRVTHLLVEEDGPADVVLRVRRRAGSSALDRVWTVSIAQVSGGASFRGRTPARAFVACRHVSSHAPLEGVATWCALSGAACLLERVSGSGVSEAALDGLIVPHHEWDVAADPRRSVVESVA